MLVTEKLEHVEDLRESMENNIGGTPSLVTGRMRLVGGLGFKKMGVASWHIRTVSHYIWVGYNGWREPAVSYRWTS